MEGLECRTLFADIGGVVLANSDGAPTLSLTAPPGAISGSVYNDLNNNGSRDPGEPGIASSRVYLDDGDWTVDGGDELDYTDRYGNFSFAGLEPGTHNLLHLPNNGYFAITPSGGRVTVQLPADRGVGDVDFGDINRVQGSFGSVTGLVFNDLNADGLWQPEEPGLGGRTLFIDVDQNGLRGVDEPAAQSDPLGRYTIDRVPSGQSHIVEVVPPGWSATNDPTQILNLLPTYTLVRNFGTRPAAGTPELESITVGGGAGTSAEQRSQVTQVTLSFNAPVVLESGALSLARLNTGGSGADDNSAPADASAALVTPPTSADGGKTWVYTFDGTSAFVEKSAAIPTASLVDGIYTATVDPAKVTAGGVAMTAAPAPFTFHRLFGDVNGSKNVNNADFGVFRLTFGKSTGQAGYDPAFDFDNNGTVNTLDYGQFRSRIGKSFAY